MVGGIELSPFWQRCEAHRPGRLFVFRLNLLFHSSDPAMNRPGLSCARDCAQVKWGTLWK